MRRTTYRSLVYYQFANLLGRAGVTHGVFTRLGGYSRSPWDRLNTGHTVGDDLEAVEANHELIFDALGVRREDVVSPHQVHSTVVRVQPAASCVTEIGLPATSNPSTFFGTRQR